MNRGARREPIFKRDEHCLIFLECLEEAARRYGLEVHAYALMPNHYHLLVRSKLGKLSEAMRHLNGRYTRILNERQGWDGPLFRGRFRSQLIHDAPSLQHVFAYVHLNPLRAGLARAVDDDCWTSLLAYLGKTKRPAWLHVGEFRRALGGAAGIRALIERRRKRPEEWPEGMDLETGRLPVPRTRDRERSVEVAFGRERPRLVPIDEVLARVCTIAGCDRTRLRRTIHGPGANPPRRFAVWALTREHGYSTREVARALSMKATQVSKLVQRIRAGGARAPLSEWMREYSHDAD